MKPRPLESAGDYVNENSERLLAAQQTVTSGPDPTIVDFIPPVRLARYRQAAGPSDVAVEQFYIWAQELAHAVFSDISVLEVAMRSAMARELSATYGGEWFRQSELFDDAAARAISWSWKLNGLQSLAESPNAQPGAVEAKLVSTLMFGFWVQLLGKGSYSGKPPFRERRAYRTLLWVPALAKAFPHAPIDGPGSNMPSRSKTERLAQSVKAARNRIAHHEHIAWGVSLPGQHSTLSVRGLQTALFTLAGYIGADIESWIRTHSEVESVISACPVNVAQLNLG